MAAVVELPVQLYRDAVEESLLLDAYRTLIERQQGPSVPPPLSMTPLNDLCLFAKETLTIENWNVFAAYAKDLSEVLPAPSHISLPWPIEDAQGLCTASNRYAMAVLEERTGTLWTAVRLVVAHMEFQPEARRQAVEPLLGLRLGASGHRAYCGLARPTATHRSVCVLLNALILLARPEHRWTSLAITVDNTIGPHKDVQNAQEPSLLISLSHHAGGELWVFDAHGSSYEEVDGRMLPGRSIRTHMNCVLLQAASVLHCVRPTTAGTRIMLIAFTIEQHRRLKDSVRKELETLGFVLP